MGHRLKILFLFVSLLAPPALADPVQKAFSDWQVTCNNQNFCLARNTGAHQGLVMSISRSAGARIDAALRIDLGGLVTPPVDQRDMASRLLLDDTPLALAGSWQILPYRLQTQDPDTIGAFLAEIQDAASITLEGSGQNISLAGLKAALHFMDDRQQRVGNETAWISRGDEPPLEVPPAPALREVAIPDAPPTPLTHQELSDLLDYGARRMNNSDCSLDPVRREVRVNVLSDARALLMVGCEAGAYNVIDMAWVVTRRQPFVARPVRLRLPFALANGEGRELELMNARYDEHTRELTTLAKWRGIGDCGIATRWRFDGQRFRLTRYAAEASCDGWHGPDAWPTLWVTK
ncbi:DUF1176 domain-containing protein [Entomohabitans teleogrylli]|uniref:DUF1176 domain-containing protein n=1 Tax=Entomohabitans teleogrylli TaxID=1384589 RepID=UPI00073D1BC2|nr:DUF1176 domain-containing protein [Entomohabitans teleogrylli]